jgi:hypothetical protein
MNWLQILQLSTALLSQALAAFAAGHTKEADASVQLPPEHAAVVRTLAAQHPSVPAP